MKGDTAVLGEAETLAKNLAATLSTAATLFPGEDAPQGAAPGALSTGAERYVLGELLGQGGMGRVSVARDKQFGRAVALKELIMEAPTLEAIQRFLQESVVTANLEHPGIVAVYERGVRDGKPFYTMRRVAGRTLSKALRDAGSLRARLELLPVLVRVAHTLGFAHERGVVHRDVKPDNVVLGEHGETVLLDWGIARVLGSADAPRLEGALEALPATPGKTIAGAVLGTPAYMAPEQAAGDTESIDARTDVFALGALLYELLTGRAPYEGSTLASLLSRALEARFEPLAKAAPEAPASLRAIVERAMARDRSARYASASELARALEHFQTDALTDTHSSLAQWYAAGAGLASVAATAFVAWLLAGMSSAFRAQGRLAWAYVGFTLLGLSLSALEWRTQGRYRARGLALALMVATVLTGLANTVTGLSMLHHALSPVAEQNLARYHSIVSAGTYEALGSLTNALMLGALQLVVLAVASRSVEQAQARRSAA